jgi:hypothetical protein
MDSLYFRVSSELDPDSRVGLESVAGHADRASGAICSPLEGAGRNKSWVSIPLEKRRLK